jgi:hypothetical protein
MLYGRADTQPVPNGLIFARKKMNPPVMKFRFALIVGMTLVFSALISYSQWEARDQGWRAAYIAGAVDSLLTYVTDEHGRLASNHYENCLKRTKMTDGQFVSGGCISAGRIDIKFCRPRRGCAISSNWPRDAADSGRIRATKS